MKITSAVIARLCMVCVALCYSAILGFVYTNVVSPIFAYEGMVTQQIPASIATLQLVLAVLPSLCLPLAMEKPSEFQVLLLYMIAYVPSIMVGYHICDSSKWGGYTAFVILLEVCLVVLAQVRRLPSLYIPSWDGPPLPRVLIVLGFTGLVYICVVAYYGIPDDAFDFTAIYKSREEFKDQAAAVPSLVNYLYWWQGVVLNPAMMIAGILRRSVLVFIAGVVLEALLFSLTTLRTMLLTVAFCIFVVFYMRTSLRWKGLGFLTFITAAMAATTAFVTTGGSIVAVMARIFVQRWLAIQGQLSGAYFDFFSDHDKAHLGNSFLQHWVPYSYGEMSPGQVIGDAYVSYGHGAISNATGNFWADAFGQFGYVGVLLATAAAFALLWIVDSAFRHYPRGTAVMLFSTCALSLTEQGVQMALLTGGFLPLVILGIGARQFFTTKTHDATTYRPFDIRT